MVMLLDGPAAPIAAFRRSPDGGRTGGCTAELQRQRLEHSGGRRPTTILPRDAKPEIRVVGAAKPLGRRGYPAAENSRRPPLRTRSALPSDRPLEGRGRGPFPARERSREPTRSTNWETGVELIVGGRPHSSRSGIGARPPGQAGRARPRGVHRRRVDRGLR